MPSERQAPSAWMSGQPVGATGAVTNIQDDPDSPDGNWVVATSNNVSTEFGVDFPTPTGNPTVGADLQEFRSLVRQFDEGQSGTPTARIELWENGSLIRAGGDSSVPDGGVVLSLTWNANEIATADGSLVQCKVIGTKTGGSPSTRNTVDCGAIEWNVDYSEAGVSGSGALVAQDSTASGAGVTSSSGSGTPAAQDVTLSGVGVSKSSGSGSLTSQVSILSGAGVSSSSGTGALSADAAAASGAGVTSSSGTGSLLSQAAQVSGAGIGKSSGTGALSASSASVSGSSGAAATVLALFRPHRKLRR